MIKGRRTSIVHSEQFFDKIRQSHSCKISSRPYQIPPEEDAPACSPTPPQLNENQIPPEADAPAPSPASPQLKKQIPPEEDAPAPPAPSPTPPHLKKQIPPEADAPSPTPPQLKNIIHTVGPDFRRGEFRGQAGHDTLAQAYLSVFERFVEANKQTLRLLPISGGIFSGGQPIPEMTAHALRRVVEYLVNKNPELLVELAKRDIWLCIFEEREWGDFLGTGAFGYSGEEEEEDQVEGEVGGKEVGVGKKDEILESVSPPPGRAQSGGGGGPSPGRAQDGGDGGPSPGRAQGGGGGPEAMQVEVEGEHGAAVAEQHGGALAGMEGPERHGGALAGMEGVVFENAKEGEQQSADDMQEKERSSSKKRPREG